jgi:HK97 gp10 family phage protein
MPVSASVTIEGLIELEKVLQKVGDSVVGVMRYAVSEGSKPIIEDAKRRIHSVDGDLAKSIHADLRVGKSGSWEAVRIGPQGGEGALGAHGHLVEFGHHMVVGGELGLGKSGRIVGEVPGHPFMRPAIRAMKGAAAARVEMILAAAIKEVVG